MGFLDSINNFATNIGALFNGRLAVKPGEAGYGIGQLQPLYEVQTPQWPDKSVLTLAQAGYSRNEIIYMCINERMDAVAEPPLAIWDGPPKDKDTQAIEDSPARELLRKPNDFMDEATFWKATQLYMDTSGFAIWEKQFTKLGDIYALYPFRTDWCSFRRGPNKLLQHVRYQMPGYPYVDVPVERLLVFMELNPIWMGLRPVSKSAIASRIGAADNATTDFMSDFFNRGTIITGVLSVKQAIDQTEAVRIKQLWRDQYGGAAHMGEPIVLGDGSDYKPIQMSLKEMDFDAIDSRNEARLCGIFKVPPMLVSAKVGLNHSTYNNYKEALPGFYQRTIQPIWRHYESIIQEQLLPHYDAKRRFFAGFDTTDVKALQEDRSAMFDRADKAFRGGWVTRDEARGEVQMDTIDKGKNVFWSDLQALIYEARAGTITDITAEDQPGDVIQQDVKPAAGPRGPLGSKPPAKPAPQPVQDQTTKALSKWRQAAINELKNAGSITAYLRVREALPREIAESITAELPTCKTASDVRAVFERHWPKAQESNTKDDATLAALVSEVRLAREALEHGK